ncbi:hypothetical protein JEQ04_22545 [Serratia plymuthica]|uniref:hypothetical protein n=1 Tax=Serratia plymuthica TaxID=82996 RepID=UPI0018E426E6|nr:hypothetical protein [Serratia plymuthica]MBI6140628.1 hypothetical protein [Serratia plymuthica]
MADLSPLNKWLKVSTWDTGHPKDDERFYKAVKETISINDNQTMDQEEVHQHIVDFHAGKVNPSRLEKLAEDYSGRFAVVVDFLYENNIKI